MIDTHDAEVEIRITPDVDGRHRVSVYVAGELVVRVYRARLVLEAPGMAGEDGDGEFDE